MTTRRLSCGPARTPRRHAASVGKSGAQYSSVQAAVNALPAGSGNPADVVITSATCSGEPDPAGGSYGTLGSATVHVLASNFTAEYITFANTFDRNNYPGVTATQAVAIAMEGDRQAYLHDIFYGHQDTLLSWGATATTPVRQYVYASAVDGDVDFIFGNGSLVLDRSSINTLNDGIYQQAFLTAPATYGSERYGILLTGCTVTSTLPAGVPHRPVSGS
jgi:pectinesterase